MCQQLFPFPFLLSLISRQEAPSTLPLKGEATIRMDKSYPLGEDLGGALSPLCPLPTSPLKGEVTVRMDKSYPLGEDLGGALSPLCPLPTSP